MNKRTFLKTSSALIAGTVLNPLVGCHEDPPLTNWAGNLTYSTHNVHYPTSVEEVRDLVKKQTSLRGLGSRHSFNTIADSEHHLVSLRDMNKFIALDPAARTVTVESGVRYGDICTYLHTNGFALHNLASLPHISIAGACATSTHGSGVTNGGLAVSLNGMEMVRADGEIVNLTRDKDGEQFYGAAVGLGALGIITKVTLDLQPTYAMQQVIYRNMPMSALESNFYTVMSSGYSVSLFTDWSNKNINQVWIKSRIDAGEPVSGPEYFGGTLAEKNLHPVEALSAENCTDQMGVAGPWFERLPHFKMGFTPSSGDELQAEYFVPMEYGYQALMAIEQMHAQITPYLFISEIRTIAEDQLWMSPFYRKPSVAIHFTFKPEWEAVQQLLPRIEAALDPYHVRPHWGKLFALSPKVLQSRIDRLADFKSLMKEYDPESKFRNAFLNKNLF